MKVKKWDTFNAILEEIWAMLRRGVIHVNDAFHCPVLGTEGKDGCNLRTVILRQLILPERILICHTDSRAPKAREITVVDKVTWLFYHPKKKVQLRVTGRATLHTDDVFADEQWAATKITSRLNYCAGESPGTPVDEPSSGLPDFLLKKVPTLFETAKGRRHFMAIACKIDSIDWLVLSVLGNRRARFDWDEKNLYTTWLIP